MEGALESVSEPKPVESPLGSPLESALLDTEEPAERELVCESVVVV